MADYTTAYADRSATVLTNIKTPNNLEIEFVSGESIRPDEIDFRPYDKPSISVNTGARFAKHDIIGGTTVRQKVGKEPRQITISGVCTEAVARDLEHLHRVTVVTLLSDRMQGITGGGVKAQVASVSTSPLEQGGAADMDSGEFLYDYTINLVEIDELGFFETQIAELLSLETATNIEKIVTSSVGRALNTAADTAEDL